ncbi:MAG: hypothetical protein WDN49_21190 [Acetobacteraceae bacterium]
MRAGRRRMLHLAAASVVLSAVGIGAASAQDALADIKKRGQIVVGTEFQFAPFEFLNGDKPLASMSICST